jgi:hypothetical protein
MSAAIHLRTEHRGEKPGLSGTDLGKPFGYSLDGAVVLDESTTACRSRAFRHVPFVRQQLGYRGHPLGGSCSSQLLTEPARQGVVPSLEYGHGRLAAVPLDDIVEQIGERRLVSTRKQCLTRGTQAVRKRRSTDASMLPLIRHQPTCLELFQVMPYGVQGKAKATRKLLRRKPGGPLQFKEDCAARTTEAERQGLGEWGGCGMGVHVGQS